MIEVRNIVHFNNRGKKDETIQRIHLKQDWDAVLIDDESDDYGIFRVAVIGSEKNVTGLFETYEKAEKFYDAFKALLPDSDAQNAVIDHKDFE